MTDDRGQSLLVLAVVLGIAAAAIVGLGEAERRILSVAELDRTGEGAAEAGAAAVADEYVRRSAPSSAGFVADPHVNDIARDAANAIARADRSIDVDRVGVACSGGRMEVTVVVRGRSHRAGFAVARCSQP